MELADVSFLDKRIGQGDVERNGNSVIRDRIVAFLLHDFNEKIVLRENYIITAEAEFQRAFFLQAQPLRRFRQARRESS